jgi:hypothetical protein
VLVNDRLDEEIILICVKDKGVYQWKPTDGKSGQGFKIASSTYLIRSLTLILDMSRWQKVQ